MRAPAKNPCGTCPYRTDVPAGVWHPEEYAKLPPFDRDTASQPPGLFLCHQQDQRVCAGWAGCHDMEESLGVRVAALTGVAEDVIEAVLDYVSPVPLFASGEEAARHGMSGVEEPPDPARKAIDNLTRKRQARLQREQDSDSTH
ncbi:hypothetical protein ASF47_18055 [Nocardioides sp. Leaf285]|nr:hypothetical protein ASF47_18055 [Nocardioides sp. Leaf285]